MAEWTGLQGEQGSQPGGGQTQTCQQAMPEGGIVSNEA